MTKRLTKRPARPASKGDILFDSNVHKAIARGYDFFTEKGENDPYKDRVYRVSDSNSYGLAFSGTGYGGWCYYNEIPDYPEGQDLRGKVNEYLLQPDRTDPNHFFAIFASKGFFGKTDPAEQKKIIEEVLARADVCPEGETKFRAFMGEDFKINPHKVRLNLGVNHNGAAVISVINHLIRESTLSDAISLEYIGQEK